MDISDFRKILEGLETAELNEVGIIVKIKRGGSNHDQFVGRLLGVLVMRLARDADISKQLGEVLNIQKIEEFIDALADAWQAVELSEEEVTNVREPGNGAETSAAAAARPLSGAKASNQPDQFKLILSRLDSITERY